SIAPSSTGRRTAGDPTGETTMSDTDHGVARRTVLKTASFGLGAGLVSGIAQARAQGMTPAAAATGEIWSSDYWANKGDVKLNLWRKRAGAPKAREPPL